jgi:TetR/AcrR family transcriptional regulator, fatty acid metabolism regulator protein
MRSKNRPDGRSFLEEARRAQVVACAIETLADEGYARASLARIAERAGVSKSVIVYHFGGKDELLEQVIAEVYDAATTAVRPRLESESTARGRLRAYIEARVGFLATHRRHMLALFEIWMNFRDKDGQLRLGESAATSTVEAIDLILRDGQRSGEFADFAPDVMAMAVRQAVDGVLLQLRVRPDLDLDTYGRELVALFERATRRPT